MMLRQAKCSTHSYMMGLIECNVSGKKTQQISTGFVCVSTQIVQYPYKLSEFSNYKCLEGVKAKGKKTNPCNSLESCESQV